MYYCGTCSQVLETETQYECHEFDGHELFARNPDGNWIPCLTLFDDHSDFPSAGLLPWLASPELYPTLEGIPLHEEEPLRPGTIDRDRLLSNAAKHLYRNYHRQTGWEHPADEAAFNRILEAGFSSYLSFLKQLSV